MITMNVRSRDYKFKIGKAYPSLNTIRIVIPKKWEYERVFLIPVDDYALVVREDSDFNEFEFELTDEVLVREVKVDNKGTKYVYIPLRFDGVNLLIVPLI